ncbi:hypothetical protein LCGC14_2284130 [marine sediment metagenome]|uniref:Uncharacterized protein n=1 Tax=marine sediment metagenome TaxID=412755 RepID=A0A0F9FNE3_9ZZZZ
MTTPTKLTQDELIELVESRITRLFLARPLFDVGVYLEQRIRTVILELFRDYHKQGRFIRQGYVPAFDVKVTGKALEDVHVHFKDEDIDFLYSEPTELQKQIIAATKRAADGEGP